MALLMNPAMKSHAPVIPNLSEGVVFEQASSPLRPAQPEGHVTAGRLTRR
jgi:hypothetical protein